MKGGLGPTEVGSTRVEGGVDVVDDELPIMEDTEPAMASPSAVDLTAWMRLAMLDNGRD